MRQLEIYVFFLKIFESMRNIQYSEDYSVSCCADICAAQISIFNHKNFILKCGIIIIIIIIIIKFFKKDIVILLHNFSLTFVHVSFSNIFQYVLVHFFVTLSLLFCHANSLWPPVGTQESDTVQ